MELVFASLAAGEYLLELNAKAGAGTRAGAGRVQGQIVSCQLQLLSASVAASWQ